jgi:phosphoribosylformimino-5-aminoimidazole carboxamide ribotide isomerase
MLVIPAIDLRGRRCVRLVQGDFAQETVYDEDPAQVARHWASLGAQWLHIVDLDGARAGRPMQLDLVARIVSAGVLVELGGGLRSLHDVRSALDRGVSRVVLGTAAIENPRLLEDVTQEFGDRRVVLGVDARDGMIAVRGWERTSTIAVAEVIDHARQIGIRRVIYTDIERDGTLSSPNLDAIQVVARTGIQVIASGGVVNRAHLVRLSEIAGVEAVIVGRALYDGTLTIHAPEDWWVEPSRRGPGERV